MANYLGFNPTERKEDYYFISYSSEDVEYVGSISRKLHDQNIPVWYDYGIDYGNKWEATISKKIIHCTAVILFFSLRVLQKKDSYVLKELIIAKDFGKPVYPVLLEEVDIKKVPEETYHHWVSIKSYQGIAAFNMNQETVLSELKRALNQSPVKLEADPAQTKPGAGMMTEKSDKGMADKSGFSANSLAEDNEEDLEWERFLEEIEMKQKYASGNQSSELKISSGLSDKPSRKNSKSLSNEQTKKELGAEEELEKLRKEILEVYSDNSVSFDTLSLQKHVKEYYQKCTEVYGESNTLTAYAHELLAYITYSNRNYRDAMPLLEKVYQRKTRESGEFHPETIDVLFMLADASQKKESIFPSLKYPKAFRKVAYEFLGREYPDSSLWESVGLSKPWITPKYRELASDGDIDSLKIFCDLKVMSSYVGEKVLHSKKPPGKSNGDLFDHFYYERDEDEIWKTEYRLYLSDLLYGPLSDQSMSQLGTLSKILWNNNKCGKSVYYARKRFERSLLRMENNISDSRSDTKNYAKQLYDRYKSMNLETCPQAQEAYQKYQELSSR